MDGVTPALFAVGALSLVAVGLSVASFVSAMRSSPTRLRLQFGELMESCDDWRGQVQRNQAELEKFREQLLEHRQHVQGVLEETLEELGRVERRRKKVTAERQRVEAADAEPEPVVCPMCQYQHPGMDCMAFARKRWAVS